jgi:hypothetical protein
LYLTVDRIGQDFWTFQWDALLLEAGFAGDTRYAFWLETFSIAHPLHALVSGPAYSHLPSDAGVGTGQNPQRGPNLEELDSAEFPLRDSAAAYALAWYAHHLPQSFQKLSCAGMFFVELIVPFLFLMPRKLRIIGAWVTIALQLVIAATGKLHLL